MDSNLYHANAPDSGVKLLTRVIRLLIPKRRRKYDLGLVVAAILHRTDNGTKWRSIGRPGLPWHVVYDYYRRWSREYVIETANALIVSALRFLEAFALTTITAPAPDPNPGHPTLVVVDSKSVRTPGWGRRERAGTDGFKLVSGVKVHCATDARGHLLAAVCSAANAHDGPWLRPLLARLRALGFTTVTCALADGAYRYFGPEADALGIRLEVTTVPEGKRLKASGFVPIPKRWVIERTFGQLRYSRAFDTVHDRLARHIEATVTWAHVRLALRQLAKL